MASYRGHLAFSSALGVAYGAVGYWYLGLDWAPACLGAGMTALGGLLPDLDSDSGVPIRELFGLLATITPFFLISRLQSKGLTSEQILVILAGCYLLIRYVLRFLFQRMTVHRGMFHSIPAMLIAGLAVYLLHHGPNPLHRMYLAGATMLGFLSHLVLDELYSVNFLGLRFKLNKYAGSALKFFSPSVYATLVTYAILGSMGYAAWLEWNA
jgi:membrane-bound metal-dependent hydrolase YbcI (DUF457 family)